MAKFFSKYELYLLSVYSPENHSRSSDMQYHVVTFYVVCVTAFYVALTCHNRVVPTLKH